jgi:hypothetical protein
VNKGEIEVESSRRSPPAASRGLSMVGGRPAPPRPPPGPIGRVVHPLSRSAALEAQMAAFQPRASFGLPNLRRNVCPHFYVTGPRGPIHIQAPHMLKAYMRQETNVSRCQVRGGVHLDQGYVSDICLSSRFNQCVFYEDELTSA